MAKVANKDKEQPSLRPMTSGADRKLTHSPTRKHGRSYETMAAIKDYILQNNLQPGDPLPTEASICEDLGVSRSSVREAISNLTALDIVEVRHGYGTFVANASMEPMVELLVFRGLLNPGSDYRVLIEIVEVRQALDLAFAPAVVRAWKGKRSAALHKVVEKMEEIAARGDSFPEEDKYFHTKLLSPLDNQLFRQLTEAFWDVHTAIQPMLEVATAKDILLTASAHGDILAAAEEGNLEKYKEAVFSHYAPLLRNLDEARNKARGLTTMEI